MAENENFDPTTITKANFSSILGIPSNNYQSVSIMMDGDVPFIRIIGTGEWNGLIVCGTRNNMEIVSNISECIIDHEAPVITINGSNPVNINVGSTYIDALATAIDNNDGDVTSKITTTSNVNPSVVGSYTVVYSVTDSKGNITTVTRIVNVVDVTAPTVTFGMNGNATWAKTRSTTVTVTDAGGIDVLKYLWNTSATAPTEATFSTVFTSGGTLSSPAGITGEYYLWILAKDKIGNTTIIKTNVFNLDNTAPIITINGSNPVSVNAGSTYTDAGATATDAHSGISGSVIATSTVVTTTLGTYTVTYNVSDLAGNVATAAVRTVNVGDDNAPIVSANAASYTITQGASNVFPGTYFSISQNGLASISSTVCVDTSNSNVTVTNTSSLGIGNHIIKCTATKTTGLNADATTTIIVNAAYTGIPSGTYAVGTILNFAGLSWKVMADNGTTDILVLNSNSQSYQIYTSYSFVSNLNSWLSNNATLLQAKNDGGLVSMSFYIGEANFNGYIRIPTYAEANADFNGPKLWYNTGGSYWTSTVAYTSNDIYGAIRNYYIVYSSGISSGPETSSCSYSGCTYTNYTNGVRPVITVKEQ